MSSSQAKYVIPEISETSSVSELVNVLRASFKKHVFDEVERLLIIQKTQLQNENCDLRKKNELLQQELKESRELVHHIKGTSEMACRKHDEVYRQLESVSAELKKMKAEKDNCRSHIFNNMLKDYTWEKGPSTSKAITPSIDLNMPPPELISDSEADFCGEQDL